eukprot:jgi/Mesvir1/1162/Mv17665-RA.1
MLRAVSRKFKPSLEDVYDAYGFKLGKLTEAEIEVRNACDKKAGQTIHKWKRFTNRPLPCTLHCPFRELACVPEYTIHTHEAFLLAMAFNKYSPKVRARWRRDLKVLIRKGVPAPLRAHVWTCTSGANHLKAAYGPGYYAKCTAACDVKSEAAQEIDADLHRTFPGHPWLDSDEGRESLRRILLAYAHHNPRVGYCQSMNFIAAYLLLVLGKEELAFFVLMALLEYVLPPDCYSYDLSGWHVEQRVLKELLAQKLPRLAAHFGVVKCDISLISTEWFMCLFAKSVPPETTLRVWDAVLAEGAKVLFRMALAIFKVCEPILLKLTSVEDMLRVLHSTAKRLHNRDLVLKIAFDSLGHLSTKAIVQRRAKQLPAVTAELRAREFRREAMAREREARALALAAVVGNGNGEDSDEDDGDLGRLKGGDNCKLMALARQTWAQPRGVKEPPAQGDLGGEDADDLSMAGPDAPWDNREPSDPSSESESGGSMKAGTLSSSSASAGETSNGLVLADRLREQLGEDWAQLATSPGSAPGSARGQGGTGGAEPVQGGGGGAPLTPDGRLCSSSHLVGNGSTRAGSGSGLSAGDAAMALNDGGGSRAGAYGSSPRNRKKLATASAAAAAAAADLAPAWPGPLSPPRRTSEDRSWGASTAANAGAGVGRRASTSDVFASLRGGVDATGPAGEGADDVATAELVFDSAMWGLSHQEVKPRHLHTD